MLRTKTEVLTMKIHSERAKSIDEYIVTHPDMQIGNWPLEIAGQKRILPFYRFPIGDSGLLCYNVNNGRLAIDMREWQQVNCRMLDATIPEDAAIVRDMILKLDLDKTKTLKEDMRKKSQMEPGVITHDGFVINGNRRMAVLWELHNAEPTGKWLLLDAVRLPEEITEQDIWKIEAGLQLSKDKIAEYHPVNELLKIKQGLNTQLTFKEIAAAMYGYTEEEIKEANDRLQIIDSFLEFFQQPGHYGLIKRHGLHEYFIDIQKSVLIPAKRKGLKGRQKSDQLMCSFALIAAQVRTQSPDIKKKKGKGITHWDVRKLGKIFADLAATETFTQNIKTSKKPWTLDPYTVIEDFHSAWEIVDMKDKRDQPVRLIERAIRALESIDRNSEHYREQRVIQAVQTLIYMVREIEKDLSK